MGMKSKQLWIPWLVHKLERYVLWFKWFISTKTNYLIEEWLWLVEFTFNTGILLHITIISNEEKGNVLFSNTLNTFNLQL